MERKRRASSLAEAEEAASTTFTAIASTSEAEVVASTSVAADQAEEKVENNNNGSQSQIVGITLLEKEGTIINDPIHGHIEISPLCMAIVNTPQFQRLRHIKQVGSGSLVYPGAVHTRFEHSIGVCHLAETLCRILQQKQPELNITESDVSCVAIAGLCHDLGHGPFSHLYDQQFVPIFRKYVKLPVWKHEQGSVDMLDYLIKVNNLQHLFSDEDLIFIKEQILPPPDKNDYKGRGQDKLFLYEIVANKRNGIDVDKWDYFLRDSYYLGLKVSFDPGRLLKFVRVINVGGEKQICARAKEVDNLYEMYHCRISLYKQAYLHKTTMIIDYMICEALRLADDHFIFPGANGKFYKMSNCMNDMEAFWKMTDDIILRILHSKKPELSRSREWIKRVFSRKLPKIVGLVKESDNPKLKWSADWVHEQLVIESVLLRMGLTTDDFIVVKRSFDYGMKEKNPLENCMFYSKHDPDVAYQVRKNQVSSFLPEKFHEVQYLVYCNEEEKKSVANEVYVAVCLKHNLLISKGAEQNGLMMTPIRKDYFQQSDEPALKKRRESLHRNLVNEFLASKGVDITGNL